MAKNKISEFSATAANNTDITNINIAEGCSPANVNNSIRSLMALLKDQQDGTSGDNFTVGGNLTVTGTTTLTGGLASALPVASGGTGATTASGARTSLSAAVTGANGDITSLTGLTTPLSVAQGGTGITALGTGVATALGQNVSGSGSIVLGTSPTLTTPALGTPSAIVLTNATGTSNSLNAGIGVNQTWQLPTRVSGTSYTNSTGKPIQALVTFNVDTSGSGTVVVVVGGVTISSQSHTISSSGGAIPYSTAFIVPNSTAYTVTVTGGTSIATWAELR
jgi:hypothetical protein